LGETSTVNSSVFILRRQVVIAFTVNEREVSLDAAPSTALL